MSAIDLPDEILDRLDALHAECPGCHGDMRAENDERMRTRLAWYCPNPDCSEKGGCWPVMEGDIRRASR